jgi:hypothetical protein
VALPQHAHRREQRRKLAASGVHQAIAIMGAEGLLRESPVQYVWHHGSDVVGGDNIAKYQMVPLV